MASRAPEPSTGDHRGKSVADTVDRATESDVRNLQVGYQAVTWHDCIVSRGQTARSSAEVITKSWHPTRSQAEAAVPHAHGGDDADV